MSSIIIIKTSFRSKCDKYKAGTNPELSVKQIGMNELKKT